MNPKKYIILVKTAFCKDGTIFTQNKDGWYYDSEKYLGIPDNIIAENKVIFKRFYPNKFKCIKFDSKTILFDKNTPTLNKEMVSKIIKLLNKYLID